MAIRIGLRRVVAFVLDWFLIVLWGGVLFVVFALLADAAAAPSGPWTGQLLGLVSMTLPVVLYFSWTESSVLEGSLGKRVLGLRVTDVKGRRLSFRAALVRNAIKFAPWEFGHLLAQQAVFSGEAGLPAWVLLPGSIAFAGPMIWLIELFRAGRTPYDRVSGAIVRAAGA